MVNRVLLICIATLFLSFNLFAQKDKDPILFTVDGHPIHVSEFNYIYSKTNGDKASFSQKSLEEYLDLYVKFKLKVQRAKDMKLDTIPALIQELDGYRKQLADSYLIDREVTEKLVQEAYERTKEDIDISHILVRVEPNALPRDTLAAYEKALEAKAALEKGGNFGTVARKYSDDKSVEKNDGRIGYVTPLFPNGFYNLETAAYDLPQKKYHGPIRTSGGYHILYVNNRRPARGEIEVQHLLIRNSNHNNDEIKARKFIDSLYTVLQGGADFEEVARAHSEDKVSAPKGGYIGFFGINRYERAFEDAAFALAENGDYTKPVRTVIGWHIIRRVNKKGIENYNISKARLQTKIKEDARYDMARIAMVERIKVEGNFMEFNTTLNSFIDSLNQNFLTYKWKASEAEKSSEDIIFIFGKEMKVTLGEYADFLQRASRKRMRMPKGTTNEQGAKMLYDEFVVDQALKYEERQLEKKYPEFKSLMREYEEGILLFEATKILVWDKASQDTSGLNVFFEKVKDKYKWEKRAVVSQYSLKESGKHLIHKIRAFAKENPQAAVLEHFNGKGEQPILTVKDKTIEQGKNEVLDRMDWEIGALSLSEISKRDRSYNFLKIEEILEPGPKTLKEARGYVVADYQDFLEQEWIYKLKEDYKVDINQKVFNSLVKK